MHSDLYDLKQAKEYLDDALAILLKKAPHCYLDVTLSLIKTSGGFGLL